MAKPNRPEKFWLGALGAVSLALLSVIFVEYEFGRVTVGEGARAPAKIAEARLLPPFALPADAPAGPEMVVRPLFVPTRRPAPPAAAASASSMKRGQFVLTGVTVSPEVSIAFLKEVANGKTASVKKGAQINGLTVDAVEPRRVVLKQGEETEDLLLNVQVPPQTAASPAPAPRVMNIFAPQAGQPGAPAAPAAPPSAGAQPPGSPLPQPAQGAATAAPTAPTAQPGQVEPPATGRRRPWIRTQ